MESTAGLATYASSSRAPSPRPPSPCWSRPAPTRSSSRDRREGSRPPSASILAAVAGQQQYPSAPLPAQLKAPNTRPHAAVASSSSQLLASWTLHGGPLPAAKTLIRTAHASNLTLEAFLRDPISWLVRMVYRLQALLRQLTKPPARTSAPSANSLTQLSTALPSTGARFAASPARVPAARRSAPGRFVPDSERTATTRLVATPAPPMAAGQRSPAPLAALALTSTAVLGCLSVWLYKRWRTMLDGKRESAQRIAIKKDSLARQKQRFQRALVVDSVNLELPPIKDMDVQPGPVRVEKIISQHAPELRGLSTAQRGMPGLAGESLRQWQKFMTASRATEVTDVTKGARGSRGAAAKGEERPYVALDDRMLADISERIRKANDVTAAGGAAAPMPVITFEQLYANNKESDNEAMARRAAERKARWQKQQASAGESSLRPSASSSVVAGMPKKQDVGNSNANGALRPGNPRTDAVAEPVSKPRPKPLDVSDNPFAAGLFPPSKGSAASSSSNGDRVSTGSGRGTNTKISSPSPPVQPLRPAGVSRLDLPGTGLGPEGSPLVRARLRDSPGSSPGSQPSKLASRSTAEDMNSVDTSAQQQIREVSPACPVTEEEQPESRTTSGNSASPPKEVAVHLKTVPRELQEAAASDAIQIGPHLVESIRRNAAAARPAPDDESASSPQFQEGAHSPSGRVKRVPAAGPLRTPDKQPALARLMRRPSGGSVPSERSQKAEGSIQLVEQL